MTDDHKARLKQHAQQFFNEEISMPDYECTDLDIYPEDMFFNVFCEPDKYPVGEKTNTVGRHLECIDHVMGSFWRVQITRLTNTAVVPTRAHSSDAGWDLYADQHVTILNGERKTINTGISLAIPSGFAGLIWPRSGMSVKKGVDVLAGVVDSGYRGEIKVCLLNTGYDPVIIDAGDRIAQILFQEVPTFEMEVVERLNATDRGEGGFGSSGD